MNKPNEVAELEERIKAAQYLMTQPMWVEYASGLKKAAMAERALASKAATPHDFAVHVGKSWAYEDAASWPEREISTLRHMLSASNNSAQMY